MLFYNLIYKEFIWISGLMPYGSLICSIFQFPQYKYMMISSYQWFKKLTHKIVEKLISSFCKLKGTALPHYYCRWLIWLHVHLSHSLIRIWLLVITYPSKCLCLIPTISTDLNTLRSQKDRVHYIHFKKMGKSDMTHIFYIYTMYISNISPVYWVYISPHLKVTISDFPASRVIVRISWCNHFVTVKWCTDCFIRWPKRE